jgi:hypothetical protein
MRQRRCTRSAVASLAAAGEPSAARGVRCVADLLRNSHAWSAPSHPPPSVANEPLRRRANERRAVPDLAHAEICTRKRQNSGGRRGATVQSCLIPVLLSPIELIGRLVRITCVRLQPVQMRRSRAQLHRFCRLWTTLELGCCVASHAETVGFASALIRDLWAAVSRLQFVRRAVRSGCRKQPDATDGCSAHACDCVHHALRICTRLVVNGRSLHARPRWRSHTAAETPAQHMGRLAQRIAAA